MPRRQFLQVLDIGDPVGEDDPVNMKYCPHWMAVLRSTNHLMSVENKPRYTPGPGSKDRWDFRPSSDEVELVKKMFKSDLEVPYNFEQTALAYKETGGKLNMRNVPKPQATTNSQTTEFCKKLGIHDPMALLLGRSGNGTIYNSYSFVKASKDTNEIDISDVPEDDTVEENEKFQDSKLEESVTEKAAEESQSSVKPLLIPQPKMDSSQENFLSVIESITTKASDNTNSASDGLFMIDTQGESNVSDNKTAPSESEQPVKKLKRRNAAMYSNTE